MGVNLKLIKECHLFEKSLTPVKVTDQSKIKLESCLNQAAHPLYRLLLLAYCVIHGHGPSNLAELLKAHEPSWQLLSANKYLLIVPRIRTVPMVIGLSRVLFHVYGMLCLTQHANLLWNTLLNSV